ncbi:unnamed protein product [Penicillium olsonii]|uniref:Nephrocystin 3-like N-terminal domain-containing protein n=1 Tax=Penicillium olsonii TaxID=99116 RepID=A0A9W4MJ01_PENOL|nr:unnamed protein product [Penicillium olsonii]CAG7977445.1 unnamed protein product [Penicillium olsonii]
MLSTGLTELSSSLTDARKDINAILSQLEEDTQIHFLNLISSIKHHDHHQNVTERRTNDTGSWLLETEEFDQWNKQSTSGVFWLEGTAGTGKTFLTSRVIDELRPSREGSRRYDGFAFFYCNHNEQNRIGLKSILMSFVRQLSTVAGHPSSMRDDLRVVCQAADKENSSLSLEDSKNQIMKSVNLYHQTILVLDALDECETDTRRQLIKFFAALVSQCDKTLKVFISSRPDDQSHAKLPHLVTFNLHQSGNKDDIERFLNVKLNELESERDVFKRKRSAIINELLEKSGGMFQWVALQIDQIAECVTLKAVQDRLSKLPEGIEAAYQEIYDNIERRHGKFEQEIAIRAFLWVVAACKPLTGQEILDAVSFNPDGNDIPRERVLDKKELSILCRNFLLEDSQGLWRFSHFSVVEYLRDRQQCNLGKAHLLAAKTCLIVLNSASQWEKSSDSGSSLSVSHEDCLDPPYNFSTYAGAFWMVHSKKAQDVEGLDFTTLTSHLESFLGRPDESSPQYRRWFQKLDNHKRQWFNADSHPNFTCQRYETRYALEQNLSPQSCSAPAACYFSLFSVLEDWWEDVDLVSDHAWMCDSGLAQTAALVGCLPIYEWISKKRGDLSSTAPDNYYNGSFTIACSEGHFELVTWLVRNGTEADEECHIYQKRNPLTAAALSGHYDIVKYLIEQAKADPNLKNDDNVDGLGTALAAASYIESFEVAELLTKKGAHVNLLFPGANHGSALAAASRGGKIEIVELLINKGADVNLLLPGGDHGSALAAASYGGNIETVELLINKGADVNLLLPGGDHGSALAAAASYGGNIETVELLINKGADVNLLLSDGNDGSALAAASFLGPIEIVELLINKGADLNLLLPNGICGSALATASFGGNIEVVELLIKKGADLNLLLPNGICGSALAAASHRGHIEIVELLINKGADVNLLLPSGKYGSALAAASQLGNVDCVRTLLASGADVNMKLRNGTWIHALQAAVAEILPGIDRFDLRWRSTAQVECDKLETTNLLRSHGASE